MKTVAIVQARMGSTRYPGKTLADLAGATLLARVLERIAAASRIDEIVVATTARPDDDGVVAEARALGFAAFRGSVDDVLDRYIQAARAHDATIVVRNTADEPFLDPALIDETWDAFHDADPPADYASNNIRHVYPEGLDTEVVAIEALETAWREATLPSEREHVTPFLWSRPERFRVVAAGGAAMRPDLRLTVDYPDDLVFARAVYEALDADVSLPNVVALLESRPDLLALCPVVPRREGYDASVREENA